MKSGEKINERLRRLEASVSKGLRDYYIGKNAEESQKVEGKMYSSTPKVIDELVVSEVSSAREAGEKFASGYEAYAHALEWVEEIEGEVECLRDDLDRLWPDVTVGLNDSVEWTNLVKDARHISAEAVRLASIAMRAIAELEEKDD